MSNAVTALCRPLQMPPSQKAVLMCLADYCHDDGKDWHSIAAIMAWTCLGKTAVIEAVKGLTAQGLIAIEKVSGKNNRTLMQLDRIELARAVADPQDGQQDQTATRTSSAPEPVRQAHYTSPPAEPSLVRLPDLPVRQADPKHQQATVKHQEHARSRSAERVKGEPAGFDAFYAAYPRKVARKKAAEVFRTLRVDRDLLQRMLVAVGRDAASEQWQKSAGQFIPYPATWLGQMRWLDESAKPTGYIGSAEGRSASGVAL